MEKECIECCGTCKYMFHHSKTDYFICKNQKSEGFLRQADINDYCGEWEEKDIEYGCKRNSKETNLQENNIW